MHSPRTAPLLLVVAISACSPPTPPKIEAAETVATTKEAPAADRSAEPASDAPAPTAVTPLAPPKAAADVDINYDTCTALAETYQKVWLRHAREKEKATGREEVVEANLRSAAETAGANWLRACASIEGTSMPRKNLVCAQRAKALQEFNDCWDGKVP